MEDRLYGETTSDGGSFRFHCETLFSRSSLHRFEIGRHRHESFLQIFHFAGGTGDAVFDDGVRAITPPSLAVVPPGFDHGFRFSRDIDGIVLTIIPGALPPASQALLTRHLNRPRVVALGTTRHADAIASICREIAQEYADRGTGFDAMVEAGLCRLIVHLTRLSRAADPSSSGQMHDARIQRLLDLVIRTVREPQPAAFYAAQLGVSQTHLNRIIKRHWGTSLQRLIARQQIETAKHELLFTLLPVRLIASEMGFSDPAYFSRFFARETGMTPKVWRMEQQRKLAPAAVSDQVSIPESSDWTARSGGR